MEAVARRNACSHRPKPHAVAGSRCRLYCTPLATGGNEQIFGESQQVPYARGCYQSDDGNAAPFPGVRQVGSPIPLGSALPSFTALRILKMLKRLMIVAVLCFVDIELPADEPVELPEVGRVVMPALALATTNKHLA